MKTDSSPTGGKTRSSTECSGRIFIRSFYRFVTAALSRVARAWVFRKFPDWDWRVALAGTTKTESSGSSSVETGGLIWLHAASAGELEMLWSVARAVRENPEWAGYSMALTVFSPSGRTRLDEFRKEFAPVYCGPSPWEGEWGSFLEELERRSLLRVSCFITAKYESWPQLWGTLALRRIPLIMVNSEWRHSLAWGICMTRWIFARLPAVYFSCVSENVGRFLRGSLESEDEENFSIRSVGDPRWDQVSRRLIQPKTRVLELRHLGETHELPRPWVFVGSAWEEDLDLLLVAAGATGFEGTVWLVPHRPSREQARDWVERIYGAGFRRILLSGLSPLAELMPEISGRASALGDRTERRADESRKASFVLVQEMGVLAELYSIGDAAWVGGGLGSGLHSVVEPALSSLWIGAGGLKAGRFPEVKELQLLGQLDLVDDQAGASAWLAKVRVRPSGVMQERWRQWRLQQHLGASGRIAAWAWEIVRKTARV